MFPVRADASEESANYLYFSPVCGLIAEWEIDDRIDEIEPSILFRIPCLPMHAPYQNGALVFEIVEIKRTEMHTVLYESNVVLNVQFVFGFDAQNRQVPTVIIDNALRKSLGVSVMLPEKVRLPVRVSLFGFPEKRAA